MYRWSLIVFTCFFLQLSLSGQESWSLERCVTEAVKNNIQIAQSDIIVIRDKISLRTAKAGRFPNLNGNTSYFESFGRQIDPTTNSFNSQNFGNQSYNLSSGVTLFNFNRINNSIKQSRLNMNASEADKQQMIRDISLEVAQAYLIVLVAKENLTIAQKSLEQTTEQLNVTDKLIAAGSKNRNSRLEIVAQQANNESQVIKAENDIRIGLLNLKQLMNVDPAKEIDIEVPAIPVPVENPDSIDYESLVLNSIKSQPQFESFAYKLQGALIAEKIAKAQGLPSLQMQASAGTSYSTLSRRIDGTTLERQQIPGAQLNGQPVSLSFLNPSVITGKNPYFSQLNQNLGFGVGVGINIPIFNGLQIRSAVQNAKLNTENIKLQNTQALQQLRSDILRSLTDARAARQQMQAAQKTFDAQKGAYADAQKRYEIGTANSFELITSKNTLDNAQRNLVIARYDYTFKMKVLDYYAGKQISFK
ncbi:MAG: TolC family protein [Saprospiraceae bacterium]|nr:TolC family protein [Saprospiraceae bacterium]